jgi:hypothetical protein
MLGFGGKSLFGRLGLETQPTKTLKAPGLDSHFYIFLFGFIFTSDCHDDFMITAPQQASSLWSV